MKRITIAILACILANSLGCYRTHYANIAPPIPPPPTNMPPEKPPDQTWIHFFVFGLAPGERRIDAAKQCGGAEHINAIETEQRFVQGLIAIFASYYINIYSPWTGRVVCGNEAPVIDQGDNDE